MNGHIKNLQCELCQFRNEINRLKLNFEIMINELEQDKLWLK